MKVNKNIEKVKELLFEMEDNIVDLEASKEILKAHNSIVFNDIYTYSYNEKLKQQFTLNYKTYQSLCHSTIDYLTKLEEELTAISDIREEAYRLLHSEDKQDQPLN